MKRYSLRLDDNLADRFEELCDKMDLSKNKMMKKLIKEELDPGVYKINTGHLAYIYRSSGVPLPPDVEEAEQKMREKKVGDKLKKSQKDSLALDLLQKEREGEILTEEQREFVNEWLEKKQSQRNNRDIMKEKGLEEQEILDAFIEGDDNE